MDGRPRSSRSKTATRWTPRSTPSSSSAGRGAGRWWRFTSIRACRAPWRTGLRCSACSGTPPRASSTSWWSTPSTASTATCRACCRPSSTCKTWGCPLSPSARTWTLPPPGASWRWPCWARWPRSTWTSCGSRPARARRPAPARACPTAFRPWVTVEGTARPASTPTARVTVPNSGNPAWARPARAIPGWPIPSSRRRCSWPSAATPPASTRTGRSRGCSTSTATGSM